MAGIPQVFVVDQDPDVRFHVGRLVEAAEFSPVGEAGLGTEAVALAAELRPDIVLCGLRDPIARTLHTVESLVHTLEQTPVIVYAETNDLEAIRQAMLAGARDFLKAPFKQGELRRSLVAALESEERRRLRGTGTSLLGPEGAIIAVYGAKGGIGKTALATNLAVALALGGQSTVLVDGDDTFGDAAASLALAPSETVTDALRSANGAGASGPANAPHDGMTRHQSGLDVLAAPLDPLEWSRFGGDQVQRLLQHLGKKFDAIVIDTASTLGERTLAVLQSASVVLWVTSTDFASVRDSMQALQAMSSMKVVPEDRIRIVLNVTSPEAEVRPEAVEQALGRPIFWTLPYDVELRRSAQLGEAVVESAPRSPAAQDLIGLSQAFGAAPIRHEGRSFAGKLFASLRLKRTGSNRVTTAGRESQA